MKGFILLLLALWLAVTVVGAVIEGLLWLLFFGLLAFVATGVWGWFKLRSALDR